jgi:type II secretory pathway predicted ATPase ExeA
VTTSYASLFSYFGLQQNPFHVSPDPHFYFSTPAHESVLSELLFAIHTRQGLMVLTGEAGAGKTTLLHQLLETLRSRGVSSSYVFHSHLEADDLFQFILEDFEVPCNSRRKADVLQALHLWLVERHAAGDSPVIILDEAQVLPTSTLDELRLLLNLESSSGKLVQIVLAGQAELEEQLRRTELRQLRQRMMFRCRLPLFDLQETSAYIHSRLAHGGLRETGLFPPETVEVIYDYSKGIPRTINLLGEHALINAFAAQKHSICPEDIHYIAADFDLVENPLSLGAGARAADKKLEHRFPLLSPELRSLSALRWEFLAQSLPQASASPDPPATAQLAPPAIVLEGALRLQASPKTGPVAASPNPPASRVHVSSPRENSKESTRGVMAGVAHESPGAMIVRRGWRRVHHKSRFVAYWKDVVDSFRRDVRTLQNDCANLMRSKSPARNGNAGD